MAYFKITRFEVRTERIYDIEFEINDTLMIWRNFLIDKIIHSSILTFYIGIRKWKSVPGPLRIKLHILISSHSDAGAYQGDMDLTPEQMAAMKKGEFSYGSVTYGRWPNGVVPYYVESSIGEWDKKLSLHGTELMMQ